jgi:hypothetical protein
MLFNIPARHNLIYNEYINHNKGVLWYTQGYIPTAERNEKRAAAKARKRGASGAPSSKASSSA